MTEKELLLRIKAAADAASFGKVKDHIGGLGGAALGAGKVIAAGLAVGAVALGVTAAAAFSAVKSAEALADAQARVGAVYGKSAADVNAAAASNANALGLTKTAYLDSAGALGQYAVNLGVTQAKAAEYGTTLTELAPKIAAYTGAEQGAVSDALQKALGGKTKALEAMGYHIEKAPKGLSDAAAAEFVYAQVLAQSANAQKAWNDNAGDTDVSLARISSSFEDAKAKAGTLIAAAVAPWLKTVADYASELSAAFQTGGLDGLVAKFNELTGIDLSGWLAALQQKWADVTAAFQDGGIVAALSEIVGFDVQPLIDNVVAAKDSFLAFWHDAVEPTAAFVLGTLVPAIVSVVGWFVKHKEVLVGAAAAYATFKTAMAVQQGITAVTTALGLAKAAWLAYKAGTLGAALATTGFSTALKIAAGPLGWLILAVGLLAAAWAGNWGGIREKTAAVVEWIKTIPAQLAAGWNQLKADLMAMVVAWSIKWAEVKQHPVKAFGEVLIFLGMLPARMLKLGVDIIVGLWNGLKQAWQRVKAWLFGAADEIHGTVAKVVQARSPSRLMFQLGMYIMLGLALGIQAYTSAGVVAARSAAEQMVDAFSELDRVRGLIPAAQAAVDSYIARVQALRGEFLRGGAAEEGSLAWLLGGAGRSASELKGLAGLDLKGVFASLNIPVNTVEQFATLLDRLVSEGDVDRAQELWSRFYDEVSKREEAIHDQRVKNIEAERKAEIDTHEDNRRRMLDEIEAQKRYFEWLKDQQAQKDQKTGTPSGLKFDDFSLHKDEIAKALQHVVDFLDYQGARSLADFWKKWTNSAQAEINTTEDLGKAIDALLDEAGKKWDELQKGIESRWDAAAATEEQRHQHAVALLKARADFISTLLADQGLAEEQLNALYTERDRLLREAQERVRDAQKAAEEYEDRVHKGVMAHIAEARDAEEGRHKWQMVILGDQQKAEDALHERRLTQLQEQRDRITDGFKERQEQIDKDKTALDQLKLDLHVEDAANKLAGLKDQLNDLLKVAESFQIVARGKDAAAQARKAITDRVRITTDEQRKALQAALDSGSLSAKDARRVQLLLLGRGTQRAEDVKRILGASADALKAEIAAQQQIVDYNTQQIGIRERMITLAEAQLKIDQQNASALLDGIDKLIKAEDDRHKREAANIATRIGLEQQRYQQTLDYLDRVADAEDRRHTQRMSDIASEYALELAKLGMTQAEIDALVQAAQAEAARIAQETIDTFAKIKEAAGGGVGSTPVPGMPGPGGSTPIGPGLPVNPGGPPIGGLRPNGDGTVTLDLTSVDAHEANVENVDFGGITMNPHFEVKLDSKDIAAEVVKALLDDVTLVDKLGKKLNERKSTSGQIGGHP